ncbi:uncharacterized protein ACA1_144080 [Acanthamoeba castellanii str. Neff]|uniref:Uncharacterized protein n=1 Tax=Acanthamoeba castellanii (strain ATCC 30010 / Neff) TaxID=1257118 RepID=L8HFJ5_ACACF|nr:uncharacterized protein ACA1_144080 [Acanthamoeba castellanii str. Neff]ELR24017.1 hypothetical protein ACA1_144080 [Acanthamoeba castellanii str. Neff]
MAMVETKDKAVEEAKGGLEELVRRAGRELGLGARADDELRAVATRLHDNWFHAPADLAHLTHDDAARLRIPLRLYQELVRMADAPPPAAAAAAAPAAPAASTTPAAPLTSAVPVAPARVKGRPRGRSGDGGRRAEGEKATGESAEVEASASAEAGTAGTKSSKTGSRRGEATRTKGEKATAMASVEGEEATTEAEGEEEEEEATTEVRARARQAGSMRLGWGRSGAVRLVARKKNTDRTPYGLRAAEIGPGLAAQLTAFRRFLTTKFYGQQESPVGQETAAMYQKHALLFLGWLWRHREAAPGAASPALPTKVQKLTLDSLFANSSRESASVVYEYVHWLVTVRGHTPSGELKALHSLVALAKFLFHKQSKSDPAEGDKAYSDIGVVRELRRLASDAAARAKIAPKVSNERAKWLDWPEYLRCVELLQSECAEKDKLHHRRSPSAVAQSFQLYLIILSCVPDRQRTLRELEVGKTLFKTEERESGAVRWEIRHGPGDYKTGKIYGERPPLLIAPHIYPYLEEYLTRWRPHLNPDHNFVFSKKNGGRPDAKWVYAVFSTAAYRLTGKRTNPHLIRDMIVTYLRDTDASERELEALAIYMGHSLKMQKTTYDRRTKQQKVAPAVHLIHSIKSTSAPFPPPPPPPPLPTTGRRAAAGQSGKA